jgi:hypothetical protein
VAAQMILQGYLDALQRRAIAVQNKKFLKAIKCRRGSS